MNLGEIMKILKKVVFASIVPFICILVLIPSLESSNLYLKYFGTFSALSIATWGMAIIMKPDQTEAEFLEEMAQAHHRDFLESKANLVRLKHDSGRLHN